MSVVSGGPFRLAPGDSVEVAVALIAGTSAQEVIERAIRARELYLMPTDVDYPDAVCPIHTFCTRTTPIPSIRLRRSPLSCRFPATFNLGFQFAGSGGQRTPVRLANCRVPPNGMGRS